MRMMKLSSNQILIGQSTGNHFTKMSLKRISLIMKPNIKVRYCLKEIIQISFVYSQGKLKSVD